MYVAQECSKYVGNECDPYVLIKENNVGKFNTLTKEGVHGYKSFGEMYHSPLLRLTKPLDNVATFSIELYDNQNNLLRIVSLGDGDKLLKRYHFELSNYVTDYIGSKSNRVLYVGYWTEQRVADETDERVKADEKDDTDIYTRG